MGTTDIRYHSIIAALYDPVQFYFERFQAPEHRQYLTDGLRGTVLEVGVGTGSMLPYYEDLHEADVHGVEPDPKMWHQTRTKLEERTDTMALVSARGERLPYPDDTFDYVIECGIFCSVPSIEPVLEEIWRVLKPDGEFRFFDHVRSSGVVGRSQDVLTPLWRRIGGNCHLNRQLRPVFEDCAFFHVEACERRRVGYWPIRHFVRGTATPADR